MASVTHDDDAVDAAFQRCTPSLCAAWPHRGRVDAADPDVDGRVVLVCATQIVDLPYHTQAQAGQGRVRGSSDSCLELSGTVGVDMS